MNPSIQFLNKKFSNYYSTSQLRYPERFTKREWGFMFIGETFMQRHLAFRKTGELIKYLSGNQPSAQTKIPSHVYYSSAYYADPGLQPMSAKVKGWLGADLIFDLDDDHLRNIAGLSYEQRLEKVKDIVRRKLLDDYFLGDFGFDPKFIKIAFSGSRGYHIHIFDPHVFSLTSPERREIVDYLIGVGLNIDRIFYDKGFKTKEYHDKKVSVKRYITPKLSSPGWKGRMARGILELYNKLSQIPDDEAKNELKLLCNYLNEKHPNYKNRKISTKEIDMVYNELFSSYREKIDEHTFNKYNVLELFSRDRYREIFVNIVRELQKVEMAGETDEPVTTDVKRLIRMPTSLHGKTGFRVVPLSIEDLRTFDPLKDAVAFNSDPVKVKINSEEQFKFRLSGEDFTVEIGETELPEFAAIYLICQRKAEIV